MKRITIGTLITTLMLIGGTQAKAADFRETVGEIEKNCSQTECRAPFRINFLYRLSAPKSGNYENQKRFEDIAFEQAQIWADTILEGDFHSDGNTRIDRLAAIYNGENLVGYLLTYSEKAWNTADCHYDGIHSITLLGCTPGRIIESSYVSLDLETYFYTEKTVASFK